MSLNTITGCRPWHAEILSRVRPKGKRDKAKLSPPEPLHIALEDMDFTWYADEVGQVARWWAEGLPLEAMAARLGREMDEVGILLIDLGRRGKIRERDGGVYGSA